MLTLLSIDVLDGNKGIRKHYETGTLTVFNSDLTKCFSKMEMPQAISLLNSLPADALTKEESSLLANLKISRKTAVKA